MPSARNNSRIAISFLLAALAACAGPGLDVDEVLADDFALEDQATTELMPIAAFDIAATALRERAELPDARPADLVAASRGLFFAADARVQLAALDALDDLDAPSLAQVVEIDSTATDRTRAEVESLTRAGKQCAERALELAEADVDALLYRGLNTVLLAWSVGKSRAVFEGLSSTCQQATKDALAADEAHSSGAPLRLRGRFLSKAPWPVGDRREGLRLLRRSVKVAPVRLNWLFLGDALFAAGDESAAIDAWRNAIDAPSDDDSIALSAYHHRLASRRLSAANDAP